MDPDKKLSANFYAGEFACNCCGRLHPDGVPETLLAYLETIRTYFGNQPVRINSGYRCPVHNANVGGAKYSQHKRGTAADFWIEDVSPKEVFQFASNLIGEDGGVGEYDTFTHIDVRGVKARW